MSYGANEYSELDCPIMRLIVVDGIRGFFLVFMAVIHANETLDVVWGKLNHHYFGWVEDAQGFVFLSGLVVGLVYGGTLVRRGHEAMRRSVWRRMRTIYSHQVGLIFILLVAAFVLAAFGIQVTPLKVYLSSPVEIVIASLALVSGSMHMGILPMYIWFMLITPLVLRAYAEGLVWTVFAISVLFWFLAQSGLTAEAVRFSEEVLSSAGHPVRLGIFFDVFGWQVLFMSGLYIGWLLANGKLHLNWMSRPDFTLVAAACFLGFLGFGIYDRIVFDYWISRDFSAVVLQGTDRGAFSVIYPISFIVDLYLVTWILVAGPTCGSKLVRALSSICMGVVTFRPLVSLGQHSLHVFSWHILAVYAVHTVDETVELSETARSLVLLLVVASLIIPVRAHVWVQGREKRAKGKLLKATQ